MEKIIEWFYWAIENYNETDVELAEWDLDVKPRGVFEDNKIMYNQYTNWFKSWCVPHSWLWCLSDQTWIAFSLDEVKKAMKLAGDKYYRKEWKGMWMAEWSDCVVDTWNTLYPNDPIYKRWCLIWSPLHMQYLQDWFSVHTWFRWNWTWNADVNDNCVLDWSSFSDTTYWHAIRCVKIWNNIVHVDNYFGTKKCNVYTIKEYTKLVNEWTLFKWWYIYTFTKSKMHTRLIPYLTGTLPEEKEIVTAWLQEVPNEKLIYKKYDDKFYIQKMLMDLAFYRKSL